MAPRNLLGFMSYVISFQFDVAKIEKTELIVIYTWPDLPSAQYSIEGNIGGV